MKNWYTIKVISFEFIILQEERFVVKIYFSKKIVVQSDNYRQVDS